MNRPVTFYGFANSLDTFSAFSATSAIDMSTIEALKKQADELLIMGTNEARTVGAANNWRRHLQDARILGLRYYLGAIQAGSRAPNGGGDLGFWRYSFYDNFWLDADAALAAHKAQIGTIVPSLQGYAPYLFVAPINTYDPSQIMTAAQIQALQDASTQIQNPTFVSFVGLQQVLNMLLEIAIADKVIIAKIWGIIKILAQVAMLGKDAPVSAAAGRKAITDFWNAVFALPVDKLYASQA